MINFLLNIFKKEESKINIFISHWNKEKLLAEYLKKYLSDENCDVDCYCSSRDMEIGEWRKKIEERARKSDVALLMLSPFSKANEWILHESGIVYGSNKKNFIVPVLFGGAKIEDIPDPIKNHQAVLLDDESSFNNIIPQIVRKNRGKDIYKNFYSGMEQKIERLCIYGYNSLIVPQKVQTNKNKILFEINKQKETYERKNSEGEISSIRLLMTPRKADSPVHWKTGIKVMKKNERIFEIHAGCHRGYATWTIYHIPGERNYKYELPAKLDMDSNCSISLWFEENRNNISIELVDSIGNHKLFLTDTNNSFWSLPKTDWDSIEVSGWCDSEEVEHKLMKYKTETIIEVDRS